MLQRVLNRSSKKYYWMDALINNEIGMFLVLTLIIPSHVIIYYRVLLACIQLLRTSIYFDILKIVV